MVSFTKGEVLTAPFVAALGLEAAARAQKVGGTGLDDIGLGPARGPFSASVAPLEAYRTPEWFRDAKFGIWAHIGRGLV